MSPGESETPGLQLQAGNDTIESTVDSLTPEVAAALRTLVDEYRTRCLWYLEPDYYPASASEAMRVLEAIERHGDRSAFQRSSEIRQWLLRNSSAASAGS